MWSAWNVLPNYAIIYFPFRKRQEQYASFKAAEVSYRGVLEAKWIECDLGKNDIEYGRVIALFDNPEEMKQKYSVYTDEYDREYNAALTLFNMSRKIKEAEIRNGNADSLSERIERRIERRNHFATLLQAGTSVSRSSTPNSNNNLDYLAIPGPSTSFNANFEEPEPSTSNGRVFPERILSREREILNSGKGFAKMVRDLLRLHFSAKTLMTHTLSGNPSPAFLDRIRPPKAQLDPEIIERIERLVSKRCRVRTNQVRQIMTTACADAKKLKANRRTM